ncbi:MAG: putative nucleotidyltransferase substrate binding domain-containing protein [Acidimicrobiales bacterium]
MPAIPDIVEFLKKYPPFVEFDAEVLEELGSAVEVEFHPAGRVIFAKGGEPVEYLRVIRSGVVEVLSEGEVLDQMRPGEMFGHASMLSGLPTSFEARAAEDTLTYAIPEEIASRALSGSHGLRFITRLILEDRHRLRRASSHDSVGDLLNQPVRAAIRASPVFCSPDTSIRTAAQMMNASDTSALLIDLGKSFGIVTDADMRSRVVAVGMSGESPVSSVMSAPAFSASETSLGSEVLLDMLDRGVRHVPIATATGQIVGVVEDHDLLDIESRSPLMLRRAIGRARDAEELVATSLRLRAAVVDMTRAGLAALDVMAIFSVISDALTRRAVEFASDIAGEPSTRFVWLALGSQARREAMPSSDVDSAIAWLGDDHGDETSTRKYCSEVAKEATNILLRCGFSPDEHRVSASDQLFVRSLSSWRQAAQSLIADPTQEKASVIVSVLVDSRPVWGVETEPLISEAFRSAATSPQLLRLLARLALSHKPPVGFLRGLVPDATGGRSHLNLKSSAVLPITDLARWAGLTAGVTCAPTMPRLHAASVHGTLTEADAQILSDAFKFVCQLRLDHQVHQLDVGHEPDDVISLADLSPLLQNYLKDVFRAIVSVQKRISNDLAWSAW